MAGKETESLTVASYNVHRCVGMDRKLDLERIATVIHELKADIVGIQEIDARFYKDRNQMDYLAKATGMNAVMAPTLRNHTGHYGNALLTHLPVKDVRLIDLSVPGKEPRGALDVDVGVNGGAVRVIIAHLGLNLAERRRQIKRLLEEFCSEHDLVEVMLGDFNEWIPVGRPLSWVHSLFGRPPSLKTFPASFPLFALDRIWVRPFSALSELQVHRTPLARRASDHLPVKAVISSGAEYGAEDLRCPR